MSPGALLTETQLKGVSKFKDVRERKAEYTDVHVEAQGTGDLQDQDQDQEFQPY